MKFTEIKRSLVWLHLKYDHPVYYAEGNDGTKYLLNEETINAVHKILDFEPKKYKFFVEC